MTFSGSTSQAVESLAAKALANRRWSKVTDRSAATAKARAAFWQRFLDEVDPDLVLPERERYARAHQARKAYYQALGAKQLASRLNKQET